MKSLKVASAFCFLILICVAFYLFNLNEEAWKSIIGHTKIGTAKIK